MAIRPKMLTHMVTPVLVTKYPVKRGFYWHCLLLVYLVSEQMSRLRCKSIKNCWYTNESTFYAVGSPIFGYLGNIPVDLLSAHYNVHQTDYTIRPWFPAGDRFKKRRSTMVIGILALIAALFLFMYSQYYWELLLARFLQGLASACVWILNMCLVADSFPQGEMGSQMGNVVVFSFIGVTCAAPIGALYHQLGYQAPFVFCIIMAAIDGIMRLLVVERRNNPKEWFDELDKRNELSNLDLPVSEKVDPVMADNELVNARKANKVSIFKLLSYSRMWGSLIIALISALYIGAIETTLTLRLAAEWDYNPSQIGLVSLAQAIPGFAAGPLTGYMTDKYGAKIVVLVCTAICAILCALLGVPNRSTGVAPLIVILVLEGFFCAGVQSPILSEIAAVVALENEEDGNSDRFAKSYALFNIAAASGLLLGPMLGGFVYSGVGYFWLNIILTCALVLCLPIIYFWIGAKGGLIQQPLHKGAEGAADNDKAEQHATVATGERIENSPTST
ncbi:hypothetical protein INT43_008948 [Umbelopsis isabellina]|uniref:Major facilitator superfamily (MFS) profile domain-containing protein n=1 Tax=Mortierella isabellina TaxID=91625 RepID=A0A8H7PX49_MORIS|nr:hypothetical protein INT43_008948 [Umbelopsis isabellina]